VTEPRDQIDAWLEGEVTPLYPRSGALDHIRHRARRRKTKQAMMTVAGCAVVVAAAVTVPQLAAHGSGSPSKLPVAASQRPPSAQPTVGASASTSPGRPATSKATQLRQRTTLSTSTSGTVPPGNFRPTSVTVVGTGTGRVVGAVIGQAGPPCATQDCTSLAGTSDYGGSWYGVSAPLAPGPDSGIGVSQLRFSNLLDGWAFGPQLWETSQGGWPWNKVATSGLRVTDLEAVGQTALAVFARCAGTSADFAADCTSFSLDAGVAGSTTWTPVAVPAAFRSMSIGRASSASLVISRGTTGYLLTPSGAVLSGPASGGSWTKAGQAPCQPGPAQADGQPADAHLAAGPTQLLLACDIQPGGASRVQLYASVNGALWQPVHAVGAPSAATSVASAAVGQVVLAGRSGIYYSVNDGKSWSPASIAGGNPAGGFSYVGMTNANQGVAVPANAGLGEIFVTSNGGQSWQRSPIAS
jgi:hypothetical protein